jgi:peptidase YpeB-like protein
MAALLAAGFLLVHVADRGGRKLSKDDAIAIARAKVDFEPTGYQIRFLRRGVPPRGYWVSSFYIEKKQGGGYKRITVVVIDAASGKVTEVHRTT